MLVRALSCTLLALALVGFGYWAGGNRERGTARGSAFARIEPHKRERDQLKLVERTIVRIERPENGPTEPAIPQRSALSDDEDSAEPDQPVPERSEAERLEEERRVLNRTYDELEARFEAQTVDKSWGSHTASSLEQAFLRANGDSARVATADVDCRSALCKSVLRYESEQDKQAFLTRFLMLNPPGLENHFKHNANEVIIYSIRRDDAIPSPE